MENLSNVLAGVIPAAGPLDRAPFKAWIMGKPTSAPSDSPTEHASASEALAETTQDNAPMPPGLSAAFTLRPKPDRRRVQIPIPAELDRRRTP
jgi:hypothetical protein